MIFYCARIVKNTYAFRYKKDCSVEGPGEWRIHTTVKNIPEEWFRLSEEDAKEALEVYSKLSEDDLPSSVRDLKVVKFTIGVTQEEL